MLLPLLKFRYIYESLYSLRVLLKLLQNFFEIKEKKELKFFLIKEMYNLKKNSGTSMLNFNLVMCIGQRALHNVFTNLSFSYLCPEIIKR